MIASMGSIKMLSLHGCVLLVKSNFLQRSLIKFVSFIEPNLHLCKQKKINNDCIEYPLIMTPKALQAQRLQHKSK